MCQSRGGASRTALFALVLALPLMSLGIPAAYAWTDENPPSASQCAAADVNDAGTVIENCKVSNASLAYVVLSGSPSQLAPLSSTPGGAPCKAGAINDAAGGHETIVGACHDANNVYQAVVWPSAAPGSPTQLLPNIGLLGTIFGIGIKSAATGINLQGIVVGEVLDGNDTGVPVFWPAGSGAPSLLAAPLLAPLANCEPADINDAAAPSVPSIVGNCPAGGGGGGKNNAVLWTTPSSAYTLLPVPSGASYCSASQISNSGQILGSCLYGTDTYRTVVWGSGGTGPTVLTTIGGNSTLALRTVGASLNDVGQVAVNFLASSGFVNPALWNTTGTDASAITLPSGATQGTAVSVGNNSKLVGNFETTAGNTHPFHVDPPSLTAVDDGSPEGGPNAVVTAESRGGTTEGGVGENAAEAAEAIEGPVL